MDIGLPHLLTTSGLVWNDVNCCRTAPEQNHCSGVKFKNDASDFSIIVSIALHCTAMHTATVRNEL